MGYQMQVGFQTCDDGVPDRQGMMGLVTHRESYLIGGIRVAA